MSEEGNSVRKNRQQILVFRTFGGPSRAPESAGALPTSVNIK
jgi:hypothetical protein